MWLSLRSLSGLRRPRNNCSIYARSVDEHRELVVGKDMRGQSPKGFQAPREWNWVQLRGRAGRTHEPARNGPSVTELVLASGLWECPSLRGCFQRRCHWRVGWGKRKIGIGESTSGEQGGGHWCPRKGSTCRKPSATQRLHSLVHLSACLPFVVCLLRPLLPHETSLLYPPK
jgi:hypothetical protein